MKEFNLQLVNHPKLEQLKQFVLEHGNGTRMIHHQSILPLVEGNAMP